MTNLDLPLLLYYEDKHDEPQSDSQLVIFPVLALEEVLYLISMEPADSMLHTPPSDWTGVQGQSPKHPLQMA